MADGLPYGYVSVAAAAPVLGIGRAGVTKRLREGRLAGTKVPQGGRQVWAVSASALHNPTVPVAQPAQPGRVPDAALAERNSVLHEVLRRRRLIDEHQAMIDRCRVLIDEQRSEIEALLLGVPAIPNN